MNQHKINKHLDSINRNRRIYKDIYSKEGGLLGRIAAFVTRGNIRKDKKELKKAKK